MTAIAILFRMTGLQEVYGRQRRSKGSVFGRWGYAVQVDRDGHGRGHEGQSVLHISKLVKPRSFGRLDPVSGARAGSRGHERSFPFGSFNFARLW